MQQMARRRALWLGVVLWLWALAGAQGQGTGDVSTSPLGFSCDNQTTYSLAGYCPRMAEAGIKWIRGFPTANATEAARQEEPRCRETEPGRCSWTSTAVARRMRPASTSLQTTGHAARGVA